MNNYELDSDEPIIKEMLDSSRNRRQFYEITKTKENIIEENENNSINSEDKENLFNKIIKNNDNSIEIDKNKKIKGRNDKIKIGRKNNSVCIGKKDKIKDLFLSDTKQINNKNILMTEVNKKKFYNLSSDKTNKNEKNNKYIYKSINENKTKDNNKRQKEKAKNKKLNTKKFSLPNNSYFYRKIASMIGKEEKMIKYINKKKSNNSSQKEKEEKLKNKNINVKFDNIYYFKKINEKFKYNKRNESQEYKNIRYDNNYINTSTTNITNGQRESSSISKIKNELYVNNQPKINYINNKINNLQVKNINNYNVDIYKYKINLINNNLTYLKENNLQEIYKKINDIHSLNRYNKFISINSNKKNYYNNKTSLKKKKYLNNSINLNLNNNLVINKYLITENNHKLYKKSCPSHFNYLDIFINGGSRKKINPILLSEKTTKKRKIINAINEGEKIKFKKLDNKSMDKNYFKSDKIQKKLIKYIPMKTQNGRPNSMEIKDIKNKDLFKKYSIPNNYLEIKNAYCFNGSNNKNIIFLKEKTPKNHLITDISENINRNNELNSELIDKIHNRYNHYSYDIRNGIKYLDNMNDNHIFNKKNMIYHKKFININNRYNNSVENEVRKKKYILELLNSNQNNKQYNNSLLLLNANKRQNKENILMKINTSKNNIYNNNKKTSVKNLKRILIKTNHFLSKEKNNKKYNLDNNPFNLPIKSNINSNNNNIIYKQKNKNFMKDNSKENNYNEQKVIDKINKISSLICCKCSIDKLKELTEKIFFKNDKNNSIINVDISYSGAILKCKNFKKINNLSFDLHISSFKDIKNYALIRPTLIKGNNLLFLELFEKLKNELLN